MPLHLSKQSQFNLEIHWAEDAQQFDKWYDLNRVSGLYFYRCLPVLDVLAALAVLAGVLTILNSSRIHSIADYLTLRVTVKNVALLLIFTAMWTGIAIKSQIPAPKSVRPFPREAAEVIRICTIGAAPGLLFLITSVSGAFGWLELIGFWAASIFVLCSVRVVLRLAGNIAGPRLSPIRHCVIAGSGERAVALSSSLARSADIRYTVLGFVDRPGAHTHPAVARQGLLGNLQQLPSILKDRVVDELLIALPMKSCYADIQSAIRTCEEVGVRCTLPGDTFSYSIAKPHVDNNPSNPAVTLEVVRTDGTLFLKRLVDIAGATLHLVILAPVFAVIAILVRATSPGPALFRQQRYGLNKRIFTIYKFRTMYQDAEQRQQELESSNEMNGPVFKIRRDPRITPLGRFLRKTSLDELPQFWNVLNGTMSLVGPRPLPLRDVSRFSDPWLMRRFSVKPGITCLWQVSGRNDIDFDRWIELDLQYIDNWSFWLDFRIIARTIWAVARGAGAA